MCVNQILMLINTPSSLNGKGEIEKYNVKFMKKIITHNKLSVHYAITTRVVKAKSFIMVENYGTGRTAIPFGQANILKLQRHRQAIDAANRKFLATPKAKGLKICEKCNNVYKIQHVCINSGITCHRNAVKYLPQGMPSKIPPSAQLAYI